MTKQEFEKIYKEYRKQSKPINLIVSDKSLLRNVTVLFIGDSYVDIKDRGMFEYSNIKFIDNSNPLDLDPEHLALGSDPEFFFYKEGKVLPSSFVVPDGSGVVIRDGFQGELNPQQSSCRQSAGNSLSYAIFEAFGLAENANASLSFKMGSFISDKEWKDAPKDMKVFGCSPTRNIYEPEFKRVSGLRERFRAAGGHIHMSLSKVQQQNIETIVKLMDIVAGNTCVLVDRDPDNARRRKNYGRAGEHRVKSYGVEYRVLSNFWLRSYTLWSMSSVLLRNAIAIFSADKAEECIALFDMKKVRKAINENDFDLAKENFLILSEFLKQNDAYGYGLSSARIDKFFKWATSKDPLKNWNTNEKIRMSWQDKQESVGLGFETFIDTL
jgi:hypothetical protein